jgi:hypothetical protein
VYLKKKKIARTRTATVAEPKADRTPIKIPLPVEPEELPLTPTRAPSLCDVNDNRRCSTFLATRSASVDGRGVEGDGNDVGFLITEVVRVDGAPTGPDASYPRIGRSRLALIL